MRALLLPLLLTVLALTTQAQTPALFPADLEDAALRNAQPDDADLEQLVGWWAQLAERPLNLNSATTDELARLPGSNLLLAQRLTAHRDSTGGLTSFYELQALPGMTDALLERWRPLVYVPDDALLETTAPTQRWQARTLLGQRAPATRGSFRGGSLRMQQRLRWQQGPWTAGILADKDPGERGVDFLSGYITYTRARWQVVVGDFAVDLGQGLVLGNGLGWQRGGDAVLSARRLAVGLQPWRSSGEAGFLRGAGAQVSLGRNWQAMAWASWRWLDASLLADSTDDYATARSIAVSGLHRTEGEWARRNTLGEAVGGARVQWQHQQQGREWRLGLSQHVQHYAVPVQQAATYYRREPLSGSTFGWTQLDWDMRLPGANFFGEVARSRYELGGRHAAHAGVLAILGDRSEAALGVRYFEAGYVGLRAQSLGRTPAAPTNEQAVYLGWTYRPQRGWVLQGWHEQFRHPAARYGVGAPSIGSETFLQVQWQPSRTRSLTFRMVWETGQRDSGSTVLRSAVPWQTVRLRLEYAHSGLLRWKVRAEGLRYRLTEPLTGGLLLGSVAWKPRRTLLLRSDVLGWWAQPMPERLYAALSDFAGLQTLGQFTGRGGAAVLLTDWQPRPQLSVGLRLGLHATAGAAPRWEGLIRVSVGG